MSRRIDRNDNSYPIAQRQKSTNGKGELNSFDEIIDALADMVATKVLARFERRSAGSAVAPRLLNVEQAATYLGRTTDAVQHMVAARKLPVVRDGRRVFLDIQELDCWIGLNTQPAEY